MKVQKKPKSSSLKVKSKKHDIKSTLKFKKQNGTDHNIKKEKQKDKLKSKVKGKKSKSSVVLELQENNVIAKKSKKEKPQKTKILKEKVEKKTKTESEFKKHKKELESLKDIDPEFYKFLKQNDKELLAFNFNDSDDDDDDVEEENTKIEEKYDSEESDNEEENEKFHKPDGNLEVASDESDFEGSDDEATDKESNTITLKLLRTWQGELQDKHVPIDTIRKVIQAFSSALASVSGEDTKISFYKVDGSAAFNGIVQLCVLHLQSAIYKYLGLKPKSNLPIHKTKKWPKIRSCLKSYLTDLARLIEHVSSSNILTVLLKHLHQMAAMIASFTVLSKPILKRLIVLWSTSEETVRVLSFLCILKITRNQQVSLLNHVLKAMYLSYIRNSKFVSPNTLPGINFMRRSLVEMFALDLNIAYQHAFLYIRQLAIHLRNAIILKKKESFQAVYNWQYVNSIKLWIELLGSTTNKPQLHPLVYPLVSITIGVIKLVPTAQYFPLRFHCIQSLVTLAKETNTFIPILPFILEVLNSNTFNKKHTIVSMKPMQFTCILRLNKSQMAENGFRDEVIENVCALVLEHLAHESCSLAFADLVVPAVTVLKQYLKTCKNANYSRKIKQLLDKIIENSKFIETERRKINFTLKDTSLIQSWETTVRNKGTPLGIYYTSWVKTHETKKKRQAANTDDINDYNIPVIKKKKMMNGEKKNSIDDELELFPSDSDDDAGLPIKENIVEQTKKKDKKKNKLKKQKAEKINGEKDNDDDIEDDGVDIVKDLDIDDW